MSNIWIELPVTSSGGTVTNVTASSPLASSGGITPNISLTGIVPIANGGTGSATQNFVDLTTIQTVGGNKTFTGSISASNLSGTNTGDVTLSTANGLSLSSQALSLGLSSTSTTGALSSTDWNTFNGKADLNSPALTGVPTAPTASVGTSTTQLATTAFVLSQGFQGATGSMPFAHQSSTSVVTSATTTYVTAISTTITTTATTAPVYAKATGTFTVTGAVPTVLKYRVSVNGVAGQEQLLSLTALTTNYTAAVQYISAALGPGTYTVLFEMARNSGTGTVSFFEGTLDAIALQGTESNGITQLTGDVTAGAGSGSQVATIANAAVTGAKIASATITGANIAATTITNSNISTVDASKITTGTLPFARGGTGATTFANQRIPFSNGTILTTDPSFIYDTTNTRLSVGGSGTAAINAIVASGSHTALQAFNSSGGNAFQATNVSAYTAALISRQANATSGASVGFEFGRGTAASPTGALSGDQIGTLVATPDAASGVAFGYCGAITFIASENATTTATGGDLLFATTPNGTLIPMERLRLTQAGIHQTKDGHFKSIQTTAPTIVVGANAGTGATASVSNATDIAGKVSITTGTVGISTGSYATITFNVAYGVAPIIVLTPASSTLSTSVYVTSTTTTFDINFAIAGGISSTYVLNYYVIETQ